MALSDFPWPPVHQGDAQPIWTGECFQYSGKVDRVIAYHEVLSNWSEDLTALHEEEAGAHHPIEVASRRLATETLLPLIDHTNPRILDVGCSSGFLLEELRRSMPNADLIGSDYLLGPLERLARRVEKLPLLQFDLRQCPLEDSSIDGITCLNVLEHIDDDEAALSQIYRILKPGGVVHLEVPSGAGLYDLYDEHLMHHRRYQMRELLAMAQRCGFTIRRATHLGFLVFPAFWWSKKKNRRRFVTSPEERALIVASQIQSSRKSNLFSVVMKMETALGKIYRFPWGIRCVLVLDKR